MKKFKQNKLWRDQAVEKMEKMGSRIHWRRLSDSEYDTELRKKLIEEAQEVLESDSVEKLKEEMADVLEVIDCLRSLHNISEEELSAEKSSKKKERGGFFQRKFVSFAEHPKGSFGESYCLADPEKYPEVP